MKIKLLLILLLSHITQFTYAQKSQNSAIGVAVGSAIVAGVATAIAIENLKDGMENNMVKWVLENKNFSNKVQFDLELIKWDAVKNEDLNSLKVAGFLYKQIDNEPIILLNALSHGWYNEYGIVYSKVNVYEINKDYWTKILKTFINISKNDDVPEINIDSIPVFNRKQKISYISIKYLSNITKEGLEFTDENGELKKFNFKIIASRIGHIAKDFDENFKIDFTEGNINLYLNKTQNLISIKRDFIIDITKRLNFTN